MRDLQQRLVADLGYLNDSRRLLRHGHSHRRDVCSQNGLDISPDATPQMQRLLYSSSAQYCVGPYIPLVIGTEYKWKSHRNDIGGFTIQLVNLSLRQGYSRL